MTFHSLSCRYAIVAALCCLSSIARSSDESPLTRWATFRVEGGASYYALSFQAAAQPKRAEPRVAILVDTSASQTGVIRKESFAILDSLIESLPDNAKISLLACDVSTVDLSGGLQVRKSSAIEHAREGLKQRVPLGTTNLAMALEKAQNSFGEKQDGVIVYIGDGVNRSNILDAGKFESMVNQLVGKRTSLISLAIGPFYDSALLASLANHTGGMIFIRDNITATPQEIGLNLARAAASPVIWPETAQLPEAMSSQYPKRFPPVRIDRDSIIIGELKDAPSDGKLAIHGSMDGKPKDMEWKVKAEASNPDFAFLELVLNDVKKNGGLTMPTPGSEALRELGLILSNSASDLVRSGRMALQTGDFKAAAEIAKEALRRDPGNAEAASLRDAARQRLEKPAAAPVKSKL